MDERQELKVFISRRASTCEECRQELGRNAWIFLAGERGALCLSCADLEHLAYLPAGDAALTRRAKSYSRLFAVVLKWSRSRNRYERQGLLVEEDALAKAESECHADEEVRQRRREREAERREELDVQYVNRFAQAIRTCFPGCPSGRARVVAEHACLKYSGRVGRSAAAKDFAPQAIRLAVVAHVRHTETDYDQLLGRGWDRFDAREHVRAQVDRVLDSWESGAS
jgi:hypothetical protein